MNTSLIENLSIVALYLRLLVTSPPDSWQIKEIPPDLPRDMPMKYAVILKRRVPGKEFPDRVCAQAVMFDTIFLQSLERHTIAHLLTRTVDAWLRQANVATNMDVPAKRLPA